MCNGKSGSLSKTSRTVLRNRKQHTNLRNILQIIQPNTALQHLCQCTYVCHPAIMYPRKQTNSQTRADKVQHIITYVLCRHYSVSSVIRIKQLQSIILHLKKDTHKMCQRLERTFIGCFLLATVHASVNRSDTVCLSISQERRCHIPAG